MKTTTIRRVISSLAVLCLAVMFMHSYAEAQMRRARVVRGPASVKAAAPKFDNAFFYTADGKFDEEKAKDAIVALCEYHGYAMFPNFRDRLWISDYGMGKFTELGLACIGFANKVDGEFSYMLQDIYLLPGQMLPEHWHIAPEVTPNCPQKDEGWLVRYGRSYIVGEGEPNLPPEVVVPACHMEGKVTVEHCTATDPGDFVPLSSVGSRHWQMGGPEGVILTEVANAHDNASVRHSDPVANKAFLGE